ncbi:MAG: 4-(cytidine 5'-diphospho)-2-C-methyl-D-erythritol kinase [Verrucomicrobiales bacterium]|nr:4-(cytidine 5'-diphospho)-2-C-methyl-D-erythritol kinase [Verrucomicrobiales bacterium]
MLLAPFLFPMLELESPCKVNLVLNILGKRPDGFHELETVMFPVPLTDRLRFESSASTSALTLTCSDPTLAVDSTNLVHRAASAFLREAGIQQGLRLHLEKRIPMAAGLGGGSGNAATTLLGLNQLFGNPLTPGVLDKLAAGLGSDVPFFLQSKPALATGRGEQVTSLESQRALHGCALFLVHPGFGISTPWAYQQLARFPSAIHGTPGRAQAMAQALQSEDRNQVGRLLYNSLEAPALEKYPVLSVYQEFLAKAGALGQLMSGSGSTTFALFSGLEAALKAEASFKEVFTSCWTSSVQL